MNGNNNNPATMSGSVAIDLTGISSNVIPANTNTVDLGSTSSQYRAVYSIAYYLYSAGAQIGSWLSTGLTATKAFLTNTTNQLIFGTGNTTTLNVVAPSA